MVDLYLLVQGCWGRKVEPRDFYTSLAEQLIDNKYGKMRLRGQGRKRTQVELLLEYRTNLGGAIPPKLQLSTPTPTKRWKKSNAKHLLQGKCMTCGKLTTYFVEYVVISIPHMKRSSFGFATNPIKSAWVLISARLIQKR